MAKKHAFATSSCPYDNASLFSKYISFYWITPLLKIGFKRNLEIDDLFGNPKEDNSHALGSDLQLEWQKEISKAARNNSKPSLLRVFFKQHSLWFFLSWLWIIFSHCIVSPLQAIVLGQIIEDSTEFYKLRIQTQPPPTQQQIDALYYKIFLEGVVLVIATAIVFLTIHPYFFCVQHLGMKLRIASCSLVYQKSLRLSRAALGKTTVGQIVNLLSNDVNRFDFGLVFIPYLIVAPLQAVIIIIILSRYYLGFGPTIAGFSFFLIYLPLQVLMGKWFGNIREETAVRTDERIRLMNEIVPAMRVIKMYAWENSFSKLVDKARRDEIKWVRYRMILTSINESIYFSSAKIIILISLFTLVFTGKQLTAEAAFVTITMLDSLRLNMTFFFPFAVASIAELIVSCDRLRNFLLSGEQPKESKISTVPTKKDYGFEGKLIPPFEPSSQSQSNVLKALQESPQDPQPTNKIDEESTENKSKEQGIYAHEISAAWIDDSQDNSADETTLSLTGINFSLKPGELLAIVGRVGSGKTSILMALLGELPIVGGNLTIYGKLSYASQEPWIFGGTVEENILFGDDLDEKRFNQVIEACALIKDIEMLPNGKETLVGERGVSLSGGQKARINLARCLYHEADIYLLDDPLSAVDASVARHIFEYCIQGFLKTKAVILVTHQFQFIKEATRIMVVDQGHQIALEHYSEMTKKVDLIGFNKGMYRSDSESEASIQVQPPGPSSPKKSSLRVAIDTPSTKHSGQQIIQSSQTAKDPEKSSRVIVDDIPVETPIRQTTEEILDSKPIDGSTYLFFLQCVQSVPLLILVVFFILVTQAIFNGSDFYLSFWTDTEERRPINGSLNANTTVVQINDPKHIFTDDLTTSQNASIYAGIVLLLFILVLFRTTCFFAACMRASITMHDKLFRSVMAAPISFFDFNPIGILLNRVSRDMGIVDDRLPQNAFDVVEIFMSTLGIIATVVVVEYINIIPAIGLIIVALIARRVCLRTINRLKEMEGILRSQVFSHLSTTLAGLTTIRSFKVDGKFVEKFDNAQDEHSVAWLTFFCSGQWLGVVLDVICLSFIMFVVIVLTATISSSILSGSQIGLAISSALLIVGPFQWGIRQLVDLESHIVSVKRIKEYSDLPKEADHETKPEFKPPTNWPQEGQIVYDHVTLSYFEDEQPVLRNLTFKIRPHEKVGIVGRTGAGKSSIISALFRMTEPTGNIIIDGVNTQSIGLKDLRRAISIIPQEPILFSGSVRKNLDPFDEYNDKALWSALESVQLKRAILDLDGGLDALVSEGGANFSVGQRQLVCLARAILRRNRILVLDEATANVDPETDQFIQRTIRELFKNCTVVTIAHRLNTVMDSDRVMVLDAGQVCEFDEPHLLLSQGGALATMTANTGQQADRLRRAAERAYNRRHNINKAI